MEITEKTLGSSEYQGFSHEGFGNFRHHQGARDIEIPGMTKQPDWERVHTGKALRAKDYREYVPEEDIKALRAAWRASGMTLRETARRVNRCYESCRPILQGSTSDQKKTRPGNVAYQALREYFGMRERGII